MCRRIRNKHENEIVKRALAQHLSCTSSVSWFWMVLGETMSSVADEDVDEIAQKIMSKIEHTSSKELAESDEMIEILHLTTVHHAKTLLQHMDEAPTQPERDVGKKAVIKALLLSTWLQRLYFIIRSFIMGILSASVTFLFILYFGSINIRLQVDVYGKIGRAHV